MIKDFIKSWIYYPKMVKYLKEKGYIEPYARLKYSLWHCTVVRKWQKGLLND